MKCHGCETEIRPEHDAFGNAERTDPDRFQGDCALHLSVTGGHGEFMDTIDGPERLIFCHDCGHRIFGLFPALVERFRGAHSLREGVAMIDAMCWGIDGDEITFGDGKRVPLDTYQASANPPQGAPDA